MGSREEPGPNYAEDGSGVPEVVGPVPPLIPHNSTLIRRRFTQIWVDRSTIGCLLERALGLQVQVIATPLFFCKKSL